MTNYELAESLLFGPGMGNREYGVFVRLNQPNIGGAAASEVEFACRGIDWDDGRFLLETKEQLVSWEYLERYVPDIRKQIATIRRERDKQAWRELHEEREQGDEGSA